MSDAAAIDRDVIRPVLIMAGKQDPLRLPGYGRELQSQIPGADLIEVEGGHCHQIDDPATFNDLVLEWLLRPATQTSR